VRRSPRGVEIHADTASIAGLFRQLSQSRIEQVGPEQQCSMNTLLASTSVIAQLYHEEGVEGVPSWFFCVIVPGATRDVLTLGAVL
jgi:hypothetical protein